MKCAGDRACIFPAVKNGLCAYHLQDSEAMQSLNGSSLGTDVMLTLDTYAFVHGHTGRKREHNSK